MKILMLTSRMDIGGAESHILTLCRELVTLGHEVFCASSGGALVPALEECGVKHVLLPLDRKDPTSLLRSARGIKRLQSEYQIDVVHSHNRIPALLSDIALKSKKKRPPLVFTAHLPYVSHPLLQWASRWGDATVAVSEDIKKHITKEYKLCSRHVTVIENGIDQKVYASSDEKRASVRASLGVEEGEFLIVTSHRSAISRAASSLYLCKNADKLLGDKDKVVILLSGKVGRERDVSEEISSLAKSQNERLGRAAITVIRGESDVSRYLCAADAFIGVSRAAAEAMCASLPVIIAGNEGYGGIFSEENALRLASSNLTARGERRDFEKLGSDLKALKNEGKRKTAAEFALAFSKERYSSALMASQTAALYRKEIKRASAPRILFIGHYGARNLGDDAIAKILSDRFGDKYYLGFVCKNKSRLSENVCGIGINRTDIRALRSFSAGASGVVLGGGNLLQDDTSLRSAFYYSKVFSIASRSAQKSAVFANGLGPLHTSFAKKLSKRVLTRADLVSLRDPVSLSEAIELSERDDLFIGADPAYLLPSPTEEQLSDCGFRRAFGGERFVCVCPRASADEAQKEAIAAFSTKLESEGTHTLFLPFAEEDSAVCAQLQKKTEGSKALHRAPSAEEALLFISCSDGCIGSRLHAAVLSLVAKRPFVGFDSDGRILRICTHARAGEYVPLSEISGRALLDAYRNASDTDGRKLDDALSRMRTLASRELDELEKLLLSTI